MDHQRFATKPIRPVDEGGYKGARLVSRSTYVLLVAFAALSGTAALSFAWVLVILTGTLNQGVVDAWLRLAEVMPTLLTGVGVAAGVSSLLWLYLTVRNVPKLGLGDPNVSPAMGVFLALMLIPYAVVRDLHARLAPADRSLHGHLIRTWWATWVVTVALVVIVILRDGTISTFDEARAEALVSMLCWIAVATSSILTAWTVRVIAAGEASAAERAEVYRRDPLRSPPDSVFSAEEATP